MANEDWPLLPYPIRKRKLVLLVPNPHHELLDCAGLLQQWAPLASETLIIYVTAGAAARGFQDADQKARWARLRRQESVRAIKALELDADIQICELDIPDSNIKTFEKHLEERLRLELDPSCVVVAPYYKDGRADHDAIGDCAKRLAASIGFEIYFFPILLWPCARPSSDKQGPGYFARPALDDCQLNPTSSATGYFENQIIAAQNSTVLVH